MTRGGDKVNYSKQLKKVVKFIGEHLDEKLTLEQLSEIACFSPFHFHRLFTTYTGVSLQQYIRWFRLKRAAHQLIVYQEKPIIEIAIHAGFESHEAFTRAFKQTCGINPNEFRVKANWHAWEKPFYGLPEKEEVIVMKVEVKMFPERRLAVIEHRGSPEKMGESVNMLIHWAESQTINLKLKAGEVFGFAYDDPNTTEPSEFRFDLGLTIPESLKLKGNIIEKRLPAGRYAFALHKGSRNNINETVYALYRNWLVQSGEELAALPCIFCYYNFDHEVAETEALTECWLLLKN